MKFVTTRAATAMMTAVLAFVLTYAGAWFTLRWLMESGFASGGAAATLRYLRADIGEFAKQNGRYPGSLKELAKWVTKQGRTSPIDESGNIGGAPYRKAFRYEAAKDNYRVFTVGPNGEVGGLELRGDLKDNPHGQVAYGPTVHEFLYESPYRGVLLWSNVVTSLLAGALCFVVPQVLRERPRSPLIAALAITVIFAAAHIRTGPDTYFAALVWIGCFVVARQIEPRRCLLAAVVLVLIGAAVLLVFGIGSLFSYLLPLIWIACFLLARRPDTPRHAPLLVVLSAVMASACAIAVSEFILSTYMMLQSG